MNQRVNDVVRACNFHLRVIRHIRQSVTTAVARTTACSIVGCRLDCCNSLLFGVNAGMHHRQVAASSEQSGAWCH